MKTISEKSYEFKSFGAGAKHNWDAILKMAPGKLGVLIQGEDYTGKTSTMGMMLRTQARKRGLVVQTGKPEGDVDGIVFKLFPASEQVKAKWAQQDADRKARKARKAASNGDDSDEGSDE